MLNLAKRRWVLLLLGGAISASCGLQQPAGGQSAPEPVTITIESWRTDDRAIWNDLILPVFEDRFPHIDVRFSPTAPTEYDLSLADRLEAATAGDLITCRPFDASLHLFERGYLAPLDDLPGINAFSSAAKSAWRTDDRATVFCVPLASVMHGFIYNQEIFDQLGLVAPETEEEFFAVLETVASDGTYIPLAMGTHDRWEAATMGFHNIGPNYYRGEEGRLALLRGEAKITDQAYLDVFASLFRWSEYLPDGHQSVTYADAQDLFLRGQAAIYPAGSWEIALFNQNAGFSFGVFKPPLPIGATTCYINDHTDIGIGLNAASPHPETARTFLSWATSAEFAQLHANALPGFFSLQDAAITLNDPIAREFLSWRSECRSTIRMSSQLLSRGDPDFETELWATSAAVIEGSLTPEQVTRRLQDGLDGWYIPTG